MFEKASRLGLRFETPVGNLTVEDLWDIPLTTPTRSYDLNRLAISLHNQLKNDVVSFVDEAVQPDEKIQLRFDIVKHIIEVKKAERKAALDAKVRADQKQKIRAILAKKRDAKLEDASEEELEKLLADL